MGRGTLSAVTRIAENETWPEGRRSRPDMNNFRRRRIVSAESLRTFGAMADSKTYGSPLDYTREGVRLGRRGPGVEYRPSELRQRAVDYFEMMRRKVWNKVDVLKGGPAAGIMYEVPTAAPLDLTGFLIFAGFGRTRWQKYRENEAYVEVCEWIELCIENQNYEGAAVGAYNANLIARRHRIADKTDTDATVRLEPITGVRITAE